MQHLIEQFGYPVLFLGTFLEGETILVVAGFLAHRMYLHLPWVIAVAFSGSLLGDQLAFFLGRRKGRGMLDRRPKWRSRAIRVEQWLQRYQVPVLVGFRFVYGFRNVTPFVAGSLGVSPLRFFLFNVIGAALWASVVAGAGYLFGETAARVIDDVKRFELLFIAVLVVAGSAIWGFHLLRQARRTKRAA